MRLLISSNLVLKKVSLILSTVDLMVLGSFTLTRVIFFENLADFCATYWQVLSPYRGRLEF